MINIQENNSIVQARQGDEIAFGIISIYVDEVDEQPDYTAKMLILTKYDIKVALMFILNSVQFTITRKLF